MPTDQIKARIFDAEQALTFAREAVEEKDREALETALRTAQTQIETARDLANPPEAPKGLGAHDR